jgi:hypothetical protein
VSAAKVPSSATSNRLGFFQHFDPVAIGSQFKTASFANRSNGPDETRQTVSGIEVPNFVPTAFRHRVSDAKVFQPM